MVVVRKVGSVFLVIVVNNNHIHVINFYLNGVDRIEIFVKRKMNVVSKNVEDNAVIVEDNLVKDIRNAIYHVKDIIHLAIVANTVMNTDNTQNVFLCCAINYIIYLLKIVVNDILVRVVFA